MQLNAINGTSLTVSIALREWQSRNGTHVGVCHCVCVHGNDTGVQLFFLHLKKAVTIKCT